MEEQNHLCICFILFLSIFLLIFNTNANEIGEEEKITFYKTKVKPLLETHCLKCHSAEKEIEGGLELTSRDNILIGGNYGPAVNLEIPDESFILEMVGYGQDNAQMPPDGKLDDSLLQILYDWIKIGIPYPTHSTKNQPFIQSSNTYWAYKPLERPSIPEVIDNEWVKNPIDAFILSTLESNGFSPAPPANKLSLIRRVYYDLTGLPPTPDAIAAFINNNESDSYGQLLDKLMKSPRYGEKWGRHWLDLVRYAETNGYERDSDKPYVWRYRDYVIKAFNTDKPYNEFVIEQLAGDELDTVTTDSIIATGYHRLGVWDDEPADRKLAKYDYLDDIVSTTGQVMLGMTIGCARCHDHKIDPISTSDYYSFLAFFHDIIPHNRGTLADIGTPEQQAERDKQLLEKQLAEEQFQNQLYPLQENIKIELSKHIEIPIAPEVQQSPIMDLTYRFYHIPKEDNPDNLESLDYIAEGKIFSNLITLSPASRKRYIGLVFNGILTVPEDSTYTFHIDLQGSCRLIIDGYKVADLIGQRELEVPLNSGKVSVRIEYINKDLDKPKLSILWSGTNFEKQPLSTTTSINFGKLLNTHKEKIESNESLKNLVEAYNKLRKQQDESRRHRIPYDHQALAISEGEQTPTHILRRGNPHLLGRVVKPAFPSSLNPPDVNIAPKVKGAKSSGKRRVIAEWIASDENPLTARVMVNRIWHYHFGRGIVRSTNDFGKLGTQPTHPELLDWLASEFISSGWRIKTLHKLIMSSNTYQMSSQKKPDYLQHDANNDTFWRFNMRRLTAEEIRDTVLLVTGNLNLKMGGRSVFTDVPEEVLATASRPGNAWGKSPPDEANRRSVYVKVKRSLLVPILNQFDQADTDSTCPVRFSTTVPTQSLTMLNSKFYNEQAVAFANRMRWEGGVTVEDQVQFGLRMVLCREPDTSETKRALKFINELQEYENLSPEVALNRFALLALNLNEFVYLD
ncbi:hypothetical protein C6497_00930 [Candidatus Poribacteria bacterium]|nr:MAG: hypothetical protein C6497_00930 [Candidatus Poribacteria bacterium]